MVPGGRPHGFSDSGRGAVWSVPFDPVHGPLGMPTPWLDWRVDSMGMPDGAAMDQEGCYWSCGIFAGAIHRFDPSGTHLESYSLPISQPTMCCFGGGDLKTLFVTSMTLRLDAVARAAQPWQALSLHSGWRLQVRLSGCLNDYWPIAVAQKWQA